MTIPEFLEELAKTPRNWRFNSYDRLRRNHSNAPVCPILAVAAERGLLLPRVGISWDNGAAKGVGIRLGLVGVDVRAIMNAADSINNTDLQKQLFAACGLDENGR